LDNFDILKLIFYGAVLLGALVLAIQADERRKRK
jgi:hypothetical protein